MPVISRFFGIAIVFYWEDHAPPHFHAKYGGNEAMVEISTGRVIEGTLPRRAASLVEEWRSAHVDELTNNWELAQQRQPLQPIDPLE